MDKKKALIVVILAMLLALVVGLLFIKTPQSEPILIPEDKTESTSDFVDLKTFDTEKSQKEVSERKDILEIKPEIKPNKTSIVEPIKQSPTIKPLQIEETKVVQGGIEETEIDAGIYKDANDIVITRDFKTKTRAKYLFEGYGIQKAPTE